MPETSAGAAAARQKLGQILKESRKKKRITVEQAADHIERTRPTVWKLETGAPGVRIRPRGDIAKLCDLYDVDDETRAALLALTEATKIKGCYQPNSDIIPPGFDVYLGLEEIASEISWYESELIPGLLQTADYAREIVSYSDDGTLRDTTEIERRVALRLHRKAQLTKPSAPDVDVILNQATLHRPIASKVTMADQLHHLNELGKLPNVTIRVLPFNAGLHHGLLSGTFELLRFPEGRPLVYVEGFMGSLWFGASEEIAKYRNVLRDLRKRALSEESSRELIVRAAKELYHS